MTRGLPLGGAIIGVVALMAFSAPSRFALATPSVMVATADSPVRLCITPDPPTALALRRGDRRLVVVVHSFQPGEPPLGRFVVSLVGAPNSEPLELTRFAVHPLRAFSVREPGRQQRFPISVEGQASMIEDGRPVCIEVAFDTAAGAVKGATADVGIELADETRAPDK
jgi:hypothetical protein